MRQRSAARDSSPGGCRKPGSNAAIGRKACGDFAYRQNPRPDARAESAVLGRYALGKPGDCNLPDTRYLARDGGDVNTADYAAMSPPLPLPWSIEHFVGDVRNRRKTL